MPAPTTLGKERQWHRRKALVEPFPMDRVPCQFRPCYLADEYPELDRSITREEFEAALASAERHGITRLDCRAMRRFAA